MQVPVFRAKDVDSNEIVEGFYFEYPVTTNPMAESTIQTNIARCLLTYKPGMMGLINEPTGCTIDLATLEFVRFIDVPCQTPQIIL